MEKVCFNSNTFALVLIINVAIILWSLYQVYIRESERHFAIIQENYAKTEVNQQTLQQIENIIDQKMTTLGRSEIDRPEILPPPGLRNPRYDERFITPVYTPTRGHPGDFYIVGYLSNSKNSDQMLKLLERYLYSNRYEYCTTHHLDQTIRIPIYTHNYEQLTDGDQVKVPGYKGKFKVHIYPRDGPLFV